MIPSCPSERLHDLLLLAQAWMHEAAIIPIIMFIIIKMTVAKKTEGEFYHLAFSKTQFPNCLILKLLNIMSPDVIGLT